MNSQYEESQLNDYAHCPPMPIHTPLKGEALNCDSPYDVEKTYDNYVFPVTYLPGTHSQVIEQFHGHHSCFEFLLKLTIFVAIIWLIIYLLLKK
jgi:hypothetical protein